MRGPDGMSGPDTLSNPHDRLVESVADAQRAAYRRRLRVNERIRDEIRNGNTPQASISLGYEKAWGTILDSNITTLIAGLALFMFGSGPIKGFAVVHVLGILTSMYSAIWVSRSLINFIYGKKRHINKLSIGEIYKVENN